MEAANLLSERRRLLVYNTREFEHTPLSKHLDGMSVSVPFVCPAGPSTSAPRVPTIPAMKVLLPRGAALDLLAELVPDRKLAAQLLDYWLKKRTQEGGPLLARLWFEQPWKVCCISCFVLMEGACSAGGLAAR